MTGFLLEEGRYEESLDADAGAQLLVLIMTGFAHSVPVGTLRFLMTFLTAGGAASPIASPASRESVQVESALGSKPQSSSSLIFVGDRGTRDDFEVIEVIEIQSICKKILPPKSGIL